MKKEDTSAVKLNHQLWGGMNYRNCHDWFPIHFVALVSLYWHLQEYEVNTLTTSLYHSSSRGGRMGFSITAAAAVTVTVATSDMLRFCKMKSLQMSIHRSPCKHYLCRKTIFFFFYPHWTQRISTRFSSSSKWENYLKALNITSQKRETEKKIHLLWNSLCFLYSALKISTRLRSQNLNYGLIFWDVAQYIQKAGKWLQPGLCLLCWSVDNMRKSLLLFAACWCFSQIVPE